MLVHSSTQHPSEVQQIIAHALGVTANRVIVQCRRMGGGFGGKETQPALIAAAGRHPGAGHGTAGEAAIGPRRRHGDDGQAARLRVRLHRRVRCLRADPRLVHTCWPRAAAIRRISPVRSMTGRYCMWTTPTTWKMSKSSAIVARPTRSPTPRFGGFGGPQGMVMIEQILDAIATISATGSPWPCGGAISTAIPLAMSRPMAGGGGLSHSPDRRRIGKDCGVSTAAPPD